MTLYKISKNRALFRISERRCKLLNVLGVKGYQYEVDQSVPKLEGSDEQLLYTIRQESFNGRTQPNLTYTGRLELTC